MDHVFQRNLIAARGGKTTGFWRSLGDGYRVHQAIWDLFSDSPNRKRDFLYRVVAETGPIKFFSVSDRPPQTDSPLWAVRTKTYAPSLTEGARLYFQLLINPIVSRRDHNGRLHRHDLIMDAKRRLGAEGVPPNERPAQARIVQEEGTAWLAARSEKNGFLVREQDVRADGYRQRVFVKRSGGHPVKISTLDVTGVLTVTAPDRFKKILFEGLGPAKAFGCGLMLVKRT